MTSEPPTYSWFTNIFLTKFLFWYFLMILRNIFRGSQDLEKVAWFQVPERFALLLIKQKAKNKQNFVKNILVNHEYFGCSDATNWLQVNTHIKIWIL